MDIQKEEKFEALPEIEMMLRENPDIKFENGVYVYHGLNQLTALAVCYVAGAWMAWKAAKANAVPEWINVNDKLPPANILVLGMSQTPRNIFNIYNVMALDEFEEADVTHWMPLPDAPQEPANADTNS